jgi:pimeloyl-ACP methyl ester carboxylesterase
MRDLVYLHGFASSAASTKATYFAARATEAGLALHCPDLNLPAFETLTITRMLAQVDDLLKGLAPEPAVLLGSSLGGLVAVEAAARQAAGPAPGVAPIQALVLLAPALDIVRGFERDFGEAEIARWHATGSKDVFHYADNRQRALGWAFFEDARRYDPSERRLELPMLVYQGRRDTLVDPDMVARWTARQPRATLHLLDDDHQLSSSLDVMWLGIRRFLSLPS